jgi:hypothetical protein
MSLVKAQDRSHVDAVLVPLLELVILVSSADTECGVLPAHRLRPPSLAIRPLWSISNHPPACPTRSGVAYCEKFLLISLLMYDL